MTGRVLCLLLAGVTIAAQLAHADVGIVVYESKGVDARRTSTGHVALLATGLCADGIDQVRVCRDGEEPGVVVTRYANLAYGYDRSVFVRPIRDHFMATSDPSMVPVLSSGGTLDAMQIEYWRTHLRPYLPPFSQERYQELRHDLDRFDLGRTFRKTISLELLISVLGPHKKQYPTEPIALIDPVTKELIPNGRWREAIGTAHMRTSIMMSAPASPEQEQRLIPFIASVNKRPFQAMTDNCSDFVERALVQVLGDSGLHFHPRIANVADAWITSPIEVATGFLNYAKRENVPIVVTPVPMLAGTRRPTAPITSISRGALVPSPTQGKMAFAMKIYFNTLNPLLGLTSYSVDKLSRFANLERLVHERGSPELSKIAYEVKSKPATSKEDERAWRREEIKTFGTRSCWKDKQDQFAALTAQAKEHGLLTAAETALLLKPGRPYLLPRLYEKTAAEEKREGVLLAGVENSQFRPTEGAMYFVRPGSVRLEETPEGEPAAKDDSAAGLPGLVPGRPAIEHMAESGEPSRRLLAFKLMTSVVNFDLSSEPLHRRTSDLFDQDWRLFLDVATKNGLHLPEAARAETLVACSCREFDGGKANSDVNGEAQGYGRWLLRQGRQTISGANR